MPRGGYFEFYPLLCKGTDTESKFFLKHIFGSCLALVRKRHIASLVWIWDVARRGYLLFKGWENQQTFTYFFRLIFLKSTYNLPCLLGHVYTHSPSLSKILLLKRQMKGFISTSASEVVRLSRYLFKASSVTKASDVWLWDIVSWSPPSHQAIEIITFYLGLFAC